MADTVDIPPLCPDCGHATAHAVAGCCTAMVPGGPGEPLLRYCGHDCYQAITGESLIDSFARSLNPDQP